MASLEIKSKTGKHYIYFPPYGRTVPDLGSGYHHPRWRLCGNKKNIGDECERAGSHDGRTGVRSFYARDYNDLEQAETALEVKNLTCEGVFSDISFRVRKGEILDLRVWWEPDEARSWNVSLEPENTRVEPFF